MSRITQISGIVVLIVLLSARSPAQNNMEGVHRQYQSVLPKWSEGDTWSMEFSGLALMKHIPTRDYYGKAKMTVTQTPADGFKNYVLRVIPADDRLGLINATFTLDANDLSLMEAKIVGRSDPNSIRHTTYPGHRIERVFLGGAGLIFPVLSTQTDANERDVFYKAGTRQASRMRIVDFEGTESLVVEGVWRDWVREDFLKRLKEGGYNYRLLWKKGDPWWTSQTWLPDGQRRVELVREQEKSLTDEETREVFVASLKHWKSCKARGDRLCAEEYYYELARLGKGAIPYMMEEIANGETDLIRAVSEITGTIPKNSTASRAIEWWQRTRPKP